MNLNIKSSRITAALAAALLATTATYAATRTVSGGGPALQNTIDISAAGDVLLVGPGTYDPITTANKAITIESTDGPAVTLIDGNGTTCCATLGGAYGHYATVLSGFTLTNGYTPASGGGAYYGTLTGCTLTGNSASYGGGTYGSTLNNCTLTGNTATYQGGGAYLATLENCILSGNSANFGGGARDGTLDNCTLTGNSATYNGGGAYYGTLNNCILTGNSANSFGGGACDSTLDNCTLTGNSANEGGGAHSGTLNNCTLTGNSANFGGGASSSTLDNCTLTGNTAPNGGGAYFGTLNNCTLTGNSANSFGGGAALATLNNCIVWGNTCGYSTLYDNYDSCTFTFSCTAPDAGGSNISADPLFVNPANGDYRLQKGSPCIDAGDNAAVTWAFDLDGRPRITNSTVDMGAYEYEYAPPPDPYLSAPVGTPATGPAAYDGFLYDGGTVCGTVTLSAKAAYKKVADRNTKVVTTTTNWTFSAKVITTAATVSLTGKWTNDFTEVTLAPSKKGAKERLTVEPCGDTFTGTFTDAQGGTFSVAGAKAQPVAAGLIGLYNVILTDKEGEGWTLGYVSLSVNNAGVAKYAGKLEDGTAVSGSAKLLKGLNGGGGWLCVALHKPLYSKKGFASGLLWLDPDPADKAIRMDKVYGWRMVRSSPASGLQEMDVLGGWFGNGKEIPSALNITGLYLDPSYGISLPPAMQGFPSYDWWCQHYVELTTTNIYAKGALSNIKIAPASKPTPPVLDKPSKRYTYGGDNYIGLTLTYTPKTGLFKGSYKMYWDGEDAVLGKFQHRVISVSYTGLMAPTRDAEYDGFAPAWGLGTATIDGQKIPMSVWLY